MEVGRFNCDYPRYSYDTVGVHLARQNTSTFWQCNASVAYSIDLLGEDTD